MPTEDRPFTFPRHVQIFDRQRRHALIVAGRLSFVFNATVRDYNLIDIVHCNWGIIHH